MDNIIFNSFGSPSYSAKSFLKTFRVGDVFKGKVMDTLPDGKYILRIRGRDIIAESNILLKSGNVYSVRVKTTFPGFSLSVINEAQEKSDLSTLAARSLMQLDIPVNNVSKSVAIQLISMDIPLTREVVSVIIEAFEKISRDEKLKADDLKIIRSLLFLFNKKIPINNRTAGLVRQILYNPGEVRGNFRRLLLNDKFTALLSGLHGDESIFRHPYLQQAAVGLLKEYTSDTIREIIQLYAPFYNSVYPVLIRFLHESLKDSEVFKYILAFIGFIQELKVINSKAPFEDQVYYLPISIPFDNDDVFIEFFYRHMTYYAENSEKIPGFEIHLLVYIDESPPLHIRIVKQVREMLQIYLVHPLKENIELLKPLYPAIKRSAKTLGYRIVKITDECADTGDADYRCALFFSGKKMVKSINITG